MPYQGVRMMMLIVAIIGMTDPGMVVDLGMIDLGTHGSGVIGVPRDGTTKHGPMVRVAKAPMVP